MKIKTIAAIVLSTVELFAIDYRVFETKAVKNAPVLESARLEKEVAGLEGTLALRFDNPSLELEASRFDGNDGNDENGWRAAVTQPIRAFGSGGDLRRYAESLETVAGEGVEKSLAGFKAALRSRYTAYVKAVRTKELMQEEIGLARRLETIANERFLEGAGTRAKVLQASLQRTAAESRLLEQERQILERYYDLLSAAQLAGDIPLDAAFIYPMKPADAAAVTPENAELDLLRAQSRLYEAEAKVNDRSVKGYRLFAAYEEEPDQSIARLGIGIDLPLFNRYEEERLIAKVRARQRALEAARLERMQKRELEALKRQLEALMHHHDALTRQAEKQSELLTLFTEGYKTAQTSLLDLIETQNALIETKRQLLQTRYLGNLCHIRIDYLQGKLQ